MISSRTPRPGDTVIEVAGRLRELIYSGVYSPDQPLRQGDLSEALGVGRTPLREAVRMLEAEGLLISTPNRGVAVGPVELGAAEELYAMRLLIEPPLLAALAERTTPEEIARMRELLADAGVNADRHRDFQRIHRAFHDIHLRHYSPAVRSMVHNLHQRVQWHQRVYMSRPRVPEDFLSVDSLFVDAIEAGNPDHVRAITELHLIDAAIGLVLDVEPDHRFGSLLDAARGVGIHIAADENGLIRRPVALTWQPPVLGLPPIHTSNVIHDPETRVRAVTLSRRQRA